MSYAVFHGKIKIECETIEEAVALAQRLEEGTAGGSVPEQADDQASGDLSPSRFRELAGTLNAGAKKFLQALADNPHGKTDQALRQILGLQTGKELGGLLSGISKRAKNAGMHIRAIYTLHQKNVGDEVLKEFRLTPPFLKLMKEIGLK